MLSGPGRQGVQAGGRDRTQACSTQAPEFKWLVVSGQPVADDFGLLANGQAVISEGALHALRAHTLDNCDVEPYSE